MHLETYNIYLISLYQFAFLLRCSVNQLEILSTTFEPLRHRDYKHASLSRYPSAPFKEGKAKNGVKKKKSGNSRSSLSISRNKSREINLSQQRSTVEDKNMKDSKQSIQDLSASLEVEARNNDDLESQMGLINSKAEKAELDEFKANMVEEKLNNSDYESVDQYASLLSSSIVMSAMNVVVDPPAHEDLKTDENESEKLNATKSEGDNDMDLSNQENNNAMDQNQVEESHTVDKPQDNLVGFTPDCLNVRENKLLMSDVCRSAQSERKSLPQSSRAASSTRYVNCCLPHLLSMYTHLVYMKLHPVI